MSTKTNILDSEPNFWDTSDTVFENLTEPTLAHLKENFSLRTDKYNGFDNNSGDSWIYPTNYPIRKYQRDIVYNSLFKNTLVVLPTGLGKTFIAAVVMYNFYRWYPQGKVVFMAPTRPLVAQQVEACYGIMGISKLDTAEMTGKEKKENRIERWKVKRVFYATPQTVASDIDDPQFPIQNIKLIVVDEAHRAKGKYAYCDVVRRISARNKKFRILALSATPGRKTDDVAEVVHNLLISHIEVRTEKCADVLPYIHVKEIQTVVVRLDGNILRYRDQLIEIIDPYVRNLIEFDVIVGSTSSLSKAWLMVQKKKYQMNCIVQRHPHHSAVITDFACCISLYHALELLERHGLWQFIHFFDSAEEKFIVAKDNRLRQFLASMRDEIGEYPFAANDTTEATLPDDFDFGHPKYNELQKCLVKHISNTLRSQAIVFCEFRDSAFLIHQLLLRRQPEIKPAIFIGQSSTSGLKGITQKQQIATMAAFREGSYNVLIATCVAEEGIDCGEVDLIVCFDVTSKNPIRLIQRMGRTGRKRNGKVVLLVTEGKEQNNLKETLAGKDYTNKKIVTNPDVVNSLCHSPRLIPSEFNPKCIETFIANEEKCNVKDVPRQMSSPKAPKKPALTSNDLRKFFQPVSSQLSTVSQLENLPKLGEHENKIKSLNEFQTNIEYNYNILKTPTFWEVIRNSRAPSSLKTFAVKRYIYEWKEKFVNQSLTDVEMSVILKAVIDRGNIHQQRSSVDETGLLSIINGIDDQNPLLSAKLLERLAEVKRVQANRIGEEAAELRKQNSLSMDVSAYEATTMESLSFQSFDETCIEVDSKYARPKELHQTTLFGFSTPLKCKENSIQSSTPLTSRKKASKRGSINDSPLKRAFERSINKSLSDKKSKTSNISNVLTFFGLNDVLDLFGTEEVLNDAIADTAIRLENSIKLFDDSLHTNLKTTHDDESSIPIRTPLTVISNQEPQEYTVSQILKIVGNVSEQNCEKETTKTSQESLKENALSRKYRTTKTLDIGTIDDIFGSDDDDAQIREKQSASDEEDIIASSQSVIFKQKLPSTIKRYHSEGCKSNQSNPAFPYTDDDMFGSFLLSNSPPSSPSDLKDLLTPFVNQQNQLPADEKPTVPCRTASKPTNTMIQSIKSPTSNQLELLSKVDRSPSMFNRKVNLSKLSSRSQTNRSSKLPNKSPLFNSCGNLKHERDEKNEAQLSRLEPCTNDGISLSDECFKNNRKSNRNYVINDTILESSQHINDRSKKSTAVFKKPKRLLKKCAFIEDECDASECSSDEFEDDIIANSIICNDEVHDDTSVDMRAVYLRSIKSPKRKNGFKLADPRKYLNTTNIFSQTVVQDNDSDYDDSFVVHEDEEDEDIDQEMSVLERAEWILKMKKKEKRKMSRAVAVPLPKRRKVVVYDDSSDENI